MTDRELFRRYPTTADIPFVELATLPTPVEPLETARERLGLGDLWIKRDDMTGPLYGGNKVRKLEFLLGAAVAKGKSRVATVGGIGSHHVLATCIYAREIGLDCSALQFPQPVTDHVLRNLRALSTTTPSLTLVSHDLDMPVEKLKSAIRQWLAEIPDTYYIPAGGSSPTGAIGYVNAALELARQIDDGELPCPDEIYVAAGTCGTLAGLTLGCRMAQLPIRVVGVRVVTRALANRTVVAALANQTGALLAEHGVEDVPKITGDDVHVLHDFIGDGYGEPTPLGLEAGELAAETEGLTLEPTYTGKAFSAILARREQLAADGVRVLYWHTLSGVDLSERVARADVERDLPPGYHEYFA